MFPKQNTATPILIDTLRFLFFSFCWFLEHGLSEELRAFSSAINSNENLYYYSHNNGGMGAKIKVGPMVYNDGSAKTNTGIGIYKNLNVGQNLKDPQVKS